MKLTQVAKAILLTAALGLAAMPVMAAQTLVLGHGAAPGNPRSLAADHFAKLVHKYTDGGITIQVQGSEQLGSDVQMLQQVQTSALALSANSQGPLATIVPEANVFGLPFLFSCPAAAWKVTNGPIGEQVAKKAAKRGIKVLDWWSNGMRDITNNVRPINEPKDVKGLDIRTPKDAVTIGIFKALNANPTPLAFGELYVALQQGTVDGQENPLVNIWSSKLYEVQKYLSLTGHKYETTPFVISMRVWNRLLPKQQDALSRAAKKAGKFERQDMVSQTKELIPKLKKAGMKVNKVDKSAFRKATQPVYDEWKEKLGSIVPQIADAAHKANALCK